MIFGYNTDLREGDVVYHVQSEVRASECVLETQVFVKGRCIAKHSTPYTDLDSRPENVQELLRIQHRSVLDGIRAGKIDSTPAERPALADPVLQCLGATWQTGDLVLQFQVTRNSAPEPDAKLRFFWAEAGAVLVQEPISELLCDGSGVASLALKGEPPVGAELQVELENGQHTIVRRFRLRPSPKS